MKVIEAGKPIRIVVFVNRDAAILAGKSRYGDHTIELHPETLTPAQRQALVDTAREAGPGLLRVACPSVVVSDASLESIQQILDSVIKEQQDNNAAREAEIIRRRGTFLDATQQFLALPVEDCLGFADYGTVEDIWGKWYHLSRKVKELLNGHYGMAWQDLSNAAEVQTRLAELEVEISARNEVLLKQRLAEQAEQKAQSQRDQEARAAKVRAQAQQINLWVEVHGSENQKARLAAGVLPEDEVKKELRAEAFKVLDSAFQRYDRMTAKDVCECQYDGPCDVTFSVEAASTMTDAQWYRASELKQSVPDATVQLRVHEGEAKGCDSKVLRYSFLVTRTVGAFEFSREYAAPAAQDTDD